MKVHCYFLRLYTGVVTIAGGNAKFSNDFDLLYVASSCSILVVDRGKQVIREIQLHQDDCSFNHFNENLLSGKNSKSKLLFSCFLYGF